MILTLLRHWPSWELAKQHGAQACFHMTHTSGVALEKAIRRAIAFGEGRGPVDVNNRFTAFAAVIGAQQNTIVTAGQAYQFLNRMLTDAFTILFPLRVDIRGQVLGHIRSM